MKSRPSLSLDIPFLSTYFAYLRAEKLQRRIWNGEADTFHVLSSDCCGELAA